MIDIKPNHIPKPRIGQRLATRQSVEITDPRNYWRDATGAIRSRKRMAEKARKG